MARLDTAGSREAGIGATAVEPVEQRKGKVARIGAQCTRRQRIDLRDGIGIPGARGDLAQECQAARADHPVGIVGIGADDAADAAIIVRDRRERKCVIGLLVIAVAMHHQQLGFRIGRLAPHGGFDAFLDLIPDFGPDLACGPAQRTRMLAADDRQIGVVVEIDQLRAPPHPHGLARGQHDAKTCLQRPGPILRWAQRRIGPVQRTDGLAHLATTLQEIDRAGLHLRTVDMDIHGFASRPGLHMPLPVRCERRDTPPVPIGTIRNTEPSLIWGSAPEGTWSRGRWFLSTGERDRGPIR